MDGITGIQPMLDGCIVRPLLDVRRAELHAWAAARSLSWRDDDSSEDLHFLRERIRGELLPQLARDYNPDIVRVLCRAAEVARGEERHWQKHVEVLARLISGEGAGWIVG